MTQHHTKGPSLTLHHAVMECISQLMNQLLCLIHPHLVLTEYAPLNQTLPWSLVFNPLFAHIVIISWYSLTSIYPSIILHLMKEQYGTTAEQMMILSEGQLTCLTRIRNYVSMMWTNMFLSSVTLMNIMRNFVPNETIKCDERDPHPWMNKELKQLIELKNQFTNNSVEGIKLYFISTSLTHSRTN